MLPDLPRELPLFPLSTVLFPGGLLPLKIFEQRYLELIKHCLSKEATFGLCGIRHGHEVGEPATPYEIGTEVRIVEWDMPQTGIFHIKVEGLARYIARSWSAQANGLLIAAVQPVTAEHACPIPEELRLCVEVLRHIQADQSMQLIETHFDDAVWVGYRLAEILPFKLAIRQDLLEMNDPLTRLRIIDQFLRKQLK